MNIYALLKTKETKIGQIVDRVQEIFEWIMHVILEFVDVMPWPF